MDFDCDRFLVSEILKQNYRSHWFYADTRTGGQVRRYVLHLSKRNRSLYGKNIIAFFDLSQVFSLRKVSVVLDEDAAR